MRRTPRKRRRRSRGGGSCLALTVLFVIVVGLPALLVRSCTVSFFSPPEIFPSSNYGMRGGGIFAYNDIGRIRPGGVVAAEMPASFDLEALKAQAVAARTYSYRRIIRDERIAEHPEAHLSADYQSGQAWVSWETFPAGIHHFWPAACSRRLRRRCALPRAKSCFIRPNRFWPFTTPAAEAGQKTQNTIGANSCPICVPWKTPPSVPRPPQHYSTASIKLDKLKKALGGRKRFPTSG